MVKINTLVKRIRRSARCPLCMGLKDRGANLCERHVEGGTA